MRLLALGHWVVVGRCDATRLRKSCVTVTRLVILVFLLLLFLFFLLLFVLLPLLLLALLPLIVVALQNLRLQSSPKSLHSFLEIFSLS
jgi:uncharacterized membrane protein